MRVVEHAERVAERVHRLELDPRVDRNSGKQAGARYVLYMATVSALRCNPVIRAFSDRLKRDGKAVKVRILACMRKLPVLLNAMARYNLKWDELDVVKKLAATPI